MIDTVAEVLEKWRVTRRVVMFTVLYVTMHLYFEVGHAAINGQMPDAALVAAVLSPLTALLVGAYGFYERGKTNERNDG
jgi:hypothetical protein